MNGRIIEVSNGIPGGTGATAATSCWLVGSRRSQRMLPGRLETLAMPPTTGTGYSAGVANWRDTCAATAERYACCCCCCHAAVAMVGAAEGVAGAVVLAAAAAAAEVVLALALVSVVVGAGMAMAATGDDTALVRSELVEMTADEAAVAAAAVTVCMGISVRGRMGTPGELLTGAPLWCAVGTAELLCRSETEVLGAPAPAVLEAGVME